MAAEREGPAPDIIRRINAFEGRQDGADIVVELARDDLLPARTNFGVADLRTHDGLLGNKRPSPLRTVRPPTARGR